MSIQALDHAVAVLKTQNALASFLGLRAASISGWRRRGQVPADRCIAIERATAGVVTRYQLRPDVFGDTPPADLQEAG